MRRGRRHFGDPPHLYLALTKRPLSSIMLKTIALILPVLIPSWRFFKAIEPSPRVQWAILARKRTAQPDWQEFRPRPARVSPWQMVRCLFWNPERNDALFIVSCAERIEQQPSDHAIREIQRRILADLPPSKAHAPDTLMQFRLVFVHRVESGLVEDVVFMSDPIPSGAQV